MVDTTRFRSAVEVHKLCDVYSDMTCLDTIKLYLANARIPVRMLRRKLMYNKARWVSLVD